jgi:hypothetical protein
MSRCVAITEVSALGVRNEKKILLSACYQHLTESLLQSFAKLGNAKNKDITFASLNDERLTGRSVLFKPNSSKDKIIWAGN